MQPQSRVTFAVAFFESGSFALAFPFSASASAPLSVSVRVAPGVLLFYFFVKVLVSSFIPAEFVCDFVGAFLVVLLLAVFSFAACWLNAG